LWPMEGKKKVAQEFKKWTVITGRTID
jgi:hypothetical protein